MLTEQNISADVATGHRQNEEGTCQILGSNANLIKRLIRYKLKYMLSQGSRVRPNFTGVRQKKNFGRTGASSHSRKKTKVSATQKVSLLFDNRHVRLISWSKPIRDSNGRTPPLIGRGPDIPVCVCAFEDACAAAVRERGE